MLCKSFQLASHSSTVPQLTTYILDNYPKFSAERVRPMVIVIPGGGYEHFGQREQESIAVKMNSMGFHAAVLNYTLAPMKFPQPLLDLAEAVAFVKKNAKEWNIDPEQIILCGFSAGGHLAASLGSYWNSSLISEYTNLKPEQVKPNTLLLNYPVITSNPEFSHPGSIKNLISSLSDDEAQKICRLTNSLNISEAVSIEKHISKDFPQTFVWHTVQDEAVPAENTLLLAMALRKAGVDFEYHLFNRGKHGLALASAETANPDGTNAEQECSIWPELFANWYKK
ncbi:MAG: alpha/beta hydrolase [Treponema sp.]|nr:alpha/beta hydrolase [Candidatus Treponema equifaecale]